MNQEEKKLSQPGTRYLLIDDDRTSNKLSEFTIRRILKVDDITVFTDPQLALDMIDEEYDGSGSEVQTILLLDINMPGMSGWDFLNQFQLLAEKVKALFTIYMLSSSIDVADKTKARSYPSVRGYLSKPLTAAGIRSIIL